MIYTTLAPFYDLLVKDEEASRMWADYTERFVKGKKILELACGSGELTLMLAKDGYEITATDLSEEMLKEAMVKEGAELVRWYPLNMLDLEETDTYDAIICYCDSINYLQNRMQLQQVLCRVHKALKKDGLFLFDMHSTDRKEEFEEEYIEEGYLDDVAYQWTIRYDEPYLYHCFTFYDKNGKMVQEQHQQIIYEPDETEADIANAGFEIVSVDTDFRFAGYQPGEKYFYVIKKKE
ncbi:MAG: class I SAM-dependent methyltransferase, partial [Erysipelotrichaceae bacterium]|nr:class I SAM-dependent methyltransferase [Erysipelotrichaceae bacterium]